MKKTKIILTNLFVYILVIANPAFSQTNFTTESITIRDGLSSNNIRDIVQDKYGYIWFATTDGLNMYDGYKIKSFKSVPGDSTSLPSNSLYRLFEDKQGTLWISTGDGLAKYNRANSTFTTYYDSTNTVTETNEMIGLNEDSKGNFWVSTEEGTLQFDRENEKFIRFDVIRLDNSVHTFINAADATIESSAGNLYTGSQTFGILKFDYDASLFVQLPLKDNFQDKLQNCRYFEIAIDQEDNLLLATQKGFFKIDLKNNTGHDHTPFRKKTTNDFWENSITGLHIDKNQNIWVGTGRAGLYFFDAKKQSFEKFKTPSSEYNYTGFYSDASGILWYGTTRGVRKYDYDRKPIETFKLSLDAEEATNRSVLSFSGSDVYKEQVWLGTMKGIYLFNKKNKTSVLGQNVITNLSNLNQTRITNIVEKNGVLWIATAGYGLYSYNLNSAKYNNFTHKDYDNSTITNDGIYKLVSDRNKDLWIGTHRGLNLLKYNSQTVVSIPSFLNRKYDPQLLAKIKDLRKNNQPTTSIINVGDYADISKEFVLRTDRKVLIYSVGEGLPEWNMADFGWLESAAGDTVWSGTDLYETFHAGGGEKNRLTIALLDLKGGRYKLRYKSDDSHSVQSYNNQPPQDSSYWGAQIFSLSDEEYTHYNEILQSSRNKTFLTGREIRTLYADSNNNMWVGTRLGLSKIDTSFSITNYSTDVTNNNALSNNLVEDIIEDRNGNIWIATRDGLNKYDPVKNKFDVFREKDGLPTSYFKALEMDDDGNLWVSSIKGISKIELDEKGETQIIVNYDVKDGLQGYEFIVRASHKDESGKLYFAGLDGFNVFYPGSSNRTKPQISLQNITVSNKSIHNLKNEDRYIDLEQLSELSLSHTQNDFSFEFASIHFSRPDKNRLMYKMDGVDEKWRVGDRRFASYTNLDPGDYIFNIRASNGDGVWSDETKKINIHIAAPWYNNWVAYFIYVVLFFGILFSIRRFEIARQQKNSEIKESQLRAEAAELKAQAVEAKALVVQAENERKTKELEEARELQLSMLPKELPQLPNLDIAVYMQTATEVGGDYYDFHVGLDGTLTVVIGDATGHGMKAGTMVTTAKSLFNSYAPNPDILFSFSEITRCIKQMNFGKLSMCLTMLKIKGDKMQISTAGMPPSFIFRQKTKVVEEHLFQGMPLGTMEKFPYEIKDTTLKPGDTILLMSDGLPELANDKEEMYGYKKIRNGFEDIAEKAPEDIITFLKNEGSAWVNDEAPDDDVTFVVIKVK
ncbi:MAG: hypothetical protein D8M58_10330 [Calditrichaeota bacterium]|nr:MAG: hypothetical protein DWQ03_09705 [Calditrichota bacterium]MBL1205786.1 hypothetical protein [Calditrichota bacterium]NOG45614.1 SpoIIE family protein phosphatase [Calditrichota bacterium]